MPAYRHERYVAAALRSALAQTYDRLEVIVIDDGSPDGTWDAIRSVNDDRLRALTHPGRVNRGLHETLRLGVAEAHGEWLAFLASDDLMWPHRIERQLAVGADVSYGRARLIDEYGAPTGDEWGAPPAAGRTPFEQLLVSNVVPAPTVLLRRETFEKSGGFRRDEVFEDVDLLLRLFAVTGRVSYLDEVLADYRVNTTGIAASVSRAGKDTIAYASAVEHVSSWPGLPAELGPAAASAARAWQAVLAAETGGDAPKLDGHDRAMVAAVEAARAPAPVREKPSVLQRLLRKLP
jgi:alpha-1,3-rhamnosyltransferase